MSLAKELLIQVNESLSDQYKQIGAFLPEILGDKDPLYEKFLYFFERAEENLKKPVVSAWFLKIVAINLGALAIYRMNEYSNLKDEKNRELLVKKMQKLCKGIYISGSNFSNSMEMYDLSSRFDPPDILNKLKHYLSFGYPEIEGFQYRGKSPDEVFDEMEEILGKYNSDEDKFYVDEEKEKQKLGSAWKEYLVFPNGWKWIRKNTHSCKFESDYGGEGHCGTAGDSGQVLLSLREPVKGNKYKIWATFSLRTSDGILIQRKGTTEVLNQETGKIKKRIGNQPPAPEIYPYIVGLLKKGIEDGTISGLSESSDYYSEHDFKVSDLPEGEDRDYLESNLNTDAYFYEDAYEEFQEEGITDHIIETVEDFYNVKFEEIEDSQYELYKFAELNEEYAMFLLNNLILGIEKEYLQEPYYPTKKALLSVVKKLKEEDKKFVTSADLYNHLYSKMGKNGKRSAKFIDEFLKNAAKVWSIGVKNLGLTQDDSFSKSPEDRITKILYGNMDKLLDYLENLFDGMSEVDMLRFFLDSVHGLRIYNKKDICVTYGGFELLVNLHEGYLIRRTHLRREATANLIEVLINFFSDVEYKEMYEEIIETMVSSIASNIDINSPPSSY